MSKIKNISLENLAVFNREMKKKYAAKSDVPTAVSALANDANYQTGEQVAAAINAKVSSTYKAGGSVDFAGLPELKVENLGLVVNVTDKFTTTDSFLEGAGAKHPAGTNVVVVKSGEEFKYDVLAGFVDLSGCATSEALTEGLAGCVKTVDLETVTEAEILALFAET